MIVIPIYNHIIVPDAHIYFQTENFRELSGGKPEVNDRVIFLTLRQQQNWDEISSDSFYPIGVVGSITEVNPAGYVGIKTDERVDVDSIFVRGAGRADLNIVRRPDIEDLSAEEEQEHLTKLKQALVNFASGFQWGPMARNYIMQWDSVGEIAAAMSGWLPDDNEAYYAILAEDSKAARVKKIEDLIYEYLEMARLSGEAQDAQKKDNEKTYRRAAIQKQMQYLQNQLEQMDPENVSDAQKFERRINEAGMNEEAEREARKMLNRFKQDGQNSAESGMLYDYLDFITSLSWKKEAPQNIDIGAAEKILDEDHFGLKKVKNRIIQQIAEMNLQQKQSGSILLFVGAPGTGKTSIGRSIARALRRKYVRVSLGGVRDEADIRGHRRTYIGAMPGRIMDGIAKSGVSNPVMVLDEVDKLSASYNGDPASALLEVLDPEQNNTFTDHYMNVPYDLSDVLFICTANRLDTIPEPLLNRMEVIEFPGYTAADKFQIARRHLLPRAMEESGIKETDLVVDDEILRTIIDDYTMEAGVRGLKKRIDTLCRAAAVKIVRAGAAANESAERAKDQAQESETDGSGLPVVVHREDLREILDTRPVSHDRVLAEKRPGVVTGLAWTQAGGEILFIETLLTKGTGKTIITGQLGDVMKESVQIAVSLVKAMFPGKAGVFEDHDLHVHVPAGAVPKDGPSAGITLTTALASLVTGTAVSPELAMTGEVSLRGVVTPIGGLPEKLMAAQRAGIKTVFIPKENEDDLRDVPAEARDALTIIPVEDVADVLEQTGLIDSRAMLEAV
ncbi:MAG: endopeptidase La [Anaerovoracaceae bacterium]|jgi:ATP-dependent Lon protease